MFVKEKKELKMGDGPGLEYWPELNCMNQDDPRLIEHIRPTSFDPLPWRLLRRTRLTMDQRWKYASQNLECHLTFLGDRSNSGPAIFL